MGGCAVCMSLHRVCVYGNDVRVLGAFPLVMQDTCVCVCVCVCVGGVGGVVHDMLWHKSGCWLQHTHNVR